MNTFRGHSFALLLTPIILLLVVAASHAQPAAATGTITGSVLDPHAMHIPNAAVTLRNTDSALTRTTATDADGHFTAAFLPPGPYTVQVKVSGFELKKPLRLTLGAASSVRVELRVAVTATRESVTVTGTAPTVEGNTLPPAVNKEEPTQRSTVAGLAVTYLPSRDRDIMQLAQLSPAVAPDASGHGVIIAGQRPENLRVVIDGAEFTDPLHGGQRGAGDTTLFFPQTAVREFQVVYSGVTAEIGGTNAAFLNIATKSGGNKRRGEAFYIGRPAALTSRDAFGHSLENAQNQFGGSVGGPIKKDRAFFYFGVEQDLLNQPYWTEFAPQAPGTVIPPQLKSLETQNVGHARPTALFGRLDFTLTPKHSLTLEADYNRVSTTAFNPVGSTRVFSSPEHQSDLTGHSLWTRANLASVLRPTAVNQLLLQWGRDHRDFTPLSTAPEIAINGFGLLGGNELGPHHFNSSDLQLSDDLSLVRGSTTLNAGALFAYDPGSEFFEPYLNGRFDFNSLQDFLANRIRRFRQTFLTGDATYHGSVRRLSFYVSAKHSFTPNFSVTAGLRWDGQWNPQPSATSLATTSRVRNDLAQWQPRLGLAWSPQANTVIRASAGLYDAVTPANVFARAFTTNGVLSRAVDSHFDPQLLTLVSNLQPLVAPPAGLTTTSALLFAIAPNLRNPRAFQTSASIEQQLTKTLSANAGYLHSSTWALRSLLDRNLFRPTIDASGLPIFPAVRPDPTLGQEFFATSNAQSTYDALLLTANAQLPRRSTLTLNYTLSRSRDNVSQTTPFARIAPLDPFNLALDRAYSDFDARHNFNLSAVINMPLGFKVNPIVLTRSGTPYTPITGFDLQNDANDLNDRALLSGAIAARNSVRQPAFFNLDLRFVKDFALRGEGHHLDLFLDIFNLTGASNRNFGPDATSLFGTAASAVFSAGQPLFAPDTTRYGSARQVQFTARIVAF